MPLHFLNHFCLTKGNTLCCIEIRIKEAKTDEGQSHSKDFFVCLFRHFQKMMDELFIQSLEKSGHNGLLIGQLIS